MGYLEKLLKEMRRHEMKREEGREFSTVGLPVGWVRRCKISAVVTNDVGFPYSVLMNCWN